MFTVQGITYAHPNGDVVFSDLSLLIHTHDKIALTGNNGTGKSTLLSVLSGALIPSAGAVKVGSKPYYIPQLFDAYAGQTVAQVLGVAGKLEALHQILDGNVTEANLEFLDDDWGIEERCLEAFDYWKLELADLSREMKTLSGGQKTKVFLAGMHIHRPEAILMDEPSNHLDAAARGQLYEFIRSTKATLVIVSHDRALLNLLHTIYELSNKGIVAYGGNYDFYVEQKRIQTEAFQHDLNSREKALRKARETEKESMERQKKLDARGKKKQESAGLPTISMNTLRNNAEKSTSRMKNVHADKTAAISKELEQLRKALPDAGKMKLDLDDSSLHKGKILLTAKEINAGYGSLLLWKNALSFQVMSGERIVVKGRNGSGKTTLLKLMLGELEPLSGTIERSAVRSIYIDQDYSLIDDRLNVCEQAELFNSGALQEHEVKIRLNRFLFAKEDWSKSCKALSEGEKMRLLLCCLTIGNHAPDLIVLDEPTNNLDIRNTGILTSAMNEYNGTLLIVSHDTHFLEEISVERSIDLD